MRHIRLTESQLNRIVLNTAKRLIRERYEGDDYWQNQEDDVDDFAQYRDYQENSLDLLKDRDNAIDTYLQNSNMEDFPNYTPEDTEGGYPAEGYFEDDRRYNSSYWDSFGKQSSPQKEQELQNVRNANKAVSDHAYKSLGMLRNIDDRLSKDDSKSVYNRVQHTLNTRSKNQASYQARQYWMNRISKR